MNEHKKDYLQYTNIYKTLRLWVLFCSSIDGTTRITYLWIQNGLVQLIVY